MTGPVNEPINVLVVEDHEVLSQSLAVALRSEGVVVTVSNSLAHDEVVGAAASIDHAVVLLDLHLGDETTSLGMIAPMTEAGAAVILLTASDETGDLARAVREGARAIVRKSEPFDRLLRTIREVAANTEAIPANRRAELLADLTRQEHARHPLLGRFGDLSAREADVLELLVAGHSPAEIAEQQFVSISTVRSQLKSIYRKLGVNSQLAAAALARRAGWRRSI